MTYGEAEEHAKPLRNKYPLSQKAVSFIKAKAQSGISSMNRATAQKKADQQLYRETYNQALKQQKINAIKQAAMNRAKKDARQSAMNIGNSRFGITGLETFKKGMKNLALNTEISGSNWSKDIGIKKKDLKF